MELDFENEGRNAEQCAKDLKKFEYAYVPKVYWNLSSKVCHFYLCTFLYINYIFFNRYLTLYYI